MCVNLNGTEKCNKTCFNKEINKICKQAVTDNVKPNKLQYRMKELVQENLQNENILLTPSKNVDISDYAQAHFAIVKTASFPNASRIGRTRNTKSAYDSRNTSLLELNVYGQYIILENKVKLNNNDLKLEKLTTNHKDIIWIHRKKVDNSNYVQATIALVKTVSFLPLRTLDEHATL